MSRPCDAFPAALAEERRLDRRRFLLAFAAAVAAVLGGKRLAARLEARRPHLAAVLHDALTDLPRGAARAIERPQGEALAVRLDDGTVVAFDRRCPHLGCPVVWAAPRNQFECPCHHAAFDARTGAVLYGPPRRGLTPVALTPARQHQEEIPK